MRTTASTTDRVWLKRALWGVLGLILALGAVWVIQTLTDTDSEDRATAEAFLETIAPSKDTSTVMLAPVESSWWQLIDGLTEQRLVLQSFDYPENATWLGYTSGRAQKPLDLTSDIMYAAFIGFGDEKAATAYFDKARHSESGIPVYQTGSVVWMTVAAVDAANETFPKEFPKDSDFSVTRGVWRYNITEDVTYLLNRSPHSNVAEPFFLELGVSPDRDKPTVWEGNASSPDDWWEGSLENYTGRATGEHKVDLSEAVFRFPSTQSRDCSEDENGEINQCIVYSEGLGDLLTVGTISSGDQTFTQEEDAPQVGEDSDLLYGSIQPDAWRSIFVGGAKIQNPVLSRLDFRVLDQDTLHLRPHLNPDLADSYK